jgi:hypothetical protein
MRIHGSTVALAMALACAGSTVFAQDKPAPAADTPLQVQIVISRYQGDKRVSSLPYTLSMSTTSGMSQANLRLNSEVPVPTTIFTPAGDGKPSSSSTSYTYRTVGTNIDVRSVARMDGKYGLSVAVQETYVQLPTGDKGVGTPSFGNYQSNNTVYVKDGEMAQFTAATDRVTGEVVRVEVTAKAMK